MVYHRPIMRTTVDTPDHLLAEAKQLAAKRHPPLTRLLGDSLRLYLSEQRLRRAQIGLLPLPLLRDPVSVNGGPPLQRLFDLRPTSALP